MSEVKEIDFNVLEKVALKHGCSPRICYEIFRDVDDALVHVPKPERYFLINYATDKVMINQMLCVSTAFPNQKTPQRLIMNADKRVLITNIFEFKSKEDFESFNK